VHMLVQKHEYIVLLLLGDKPQSTKKGKRLSGSASSLPQGFTLCARRISDHSGNLVLEETVVEHGLTDQLGKLKPVDMCFEPKANILVAVGRDGSFAAWRFSGVDALLSPNLPAIVTHQVGRENHRVGKCFPVGASMIALTVEERDSAALEVWHVDYGVMCSHFTLKQTSSDPIKHVLHSPDSDWVVLAGNHDILCCRLHCADSSLAALVGKKAASIEASQVPRVVKLDALLGLDDEPPAEDAVASSIAKIAAAPTENAEGEGGKEGEPRRRRRKKNRHNMADTEDQAAQEKMCVVTTGSGGSDTLVDTTSAEVALLDSLATASPASFLQLLERHLADHRHSMQEGDTDDVKEGSQTGTKKKLPLYAVMRERRAQRAKREKGEVVWALSQPFVHKCVRLCLEKCGHKCGSTRAASHSLVLEPPPAPRPASRDTPAYSSALRALLETNMVSIHANPELVPAIIADRQLALIEAVLLHVYDLSEACLTQILAFIIAHRDMPQLSDFTKQRLWALAPHHYFLHLIVSKPVSAPFLQDSLASVSTDDILVFIDYLRTCLGLHLTHSEAEVRSMSTAQPVGEAPDGSPAKGKKARGQATTNGPLAPGKARKHTQPTITHLLDWLTCAVDAHMPALLSQPGNHPLVADVAADIGRHVGLSVALEGLRGVVSLLSAGGHVQSSHVLPDYRVEVLRI